MTDCGGRDFQVNRRQFHIHTRDRGVDFPAAEMAVQGTELPVLRWQVTRCLVTGFKSFN
jgi:hypothetical protein